MDLVMLILVTAIVVWKNIYTICLISKFHKIKNTKEEAINILFLFNYVIYYYFVCMAAFDCVDSPLEEPFWLIIIFIILTTFNIMYDLRIFKFNE